MSRKYLTPTNNIPSPTVPNNTGTLYKMTIAKVLSNGQIDGSTLTAGRLELNPDSLEESIDTNWSTHQIPGQSNPIMQWTSGGPRVITFDALVTKDTSEFLNKPSNPLEALANTAVNAIGSIASASVGVNLPPIGDLLGGFTQGQGEDLSINQQLDYFRSILYPSYINGSLDQSPPLIAIFAGKTFDNTLTAPSATSITADTTVWVCTSLKIRVTKQLPNLAPMEATVSFRFMQYPFKGMDATKFSGVTMPSIKGLDASLGGLLT